VVGDVVTGCHVIGPDTQLELVSERTQYATHRAAVQCRISCKGCRFCSLPVERGERLARMLSVRKAEPTLRMATWRSRLHLIVVIRARVADLWRDVVWLSRTFSDELFESRRQRPFSCLPIEERDVGQSRKVSGDGGGV